MLPNNPNFSNYSDLAFYSLQQRASLPHDQITAESQPQPKEMAPIEAALTVANTCQQRKRTYRSDRHSKIRTAQGERDRRMRLSVKVAHEFFALQDKLGFDKASKTIDWLLTQAKDSIDHLSSSSSEHTNEEILTDHTIITDQASPPHYHEPHATLVLQKPNQVGECQLKAKDLRIKARARARERARGKKVVSGQRDQLVMAADPSVNASLDGNCNGMEYYYDLLNEIMNGGFCSVDIDEEGTTSAKAQFN